MGPFSDRHDAGRALARSLRGRVAGDVVVLGLPRGGVPVAAEVAAELAAPLDVYLVRKLGVPRQPELALGAIASGGVRVLNDDVVRAAGITAEELDELTRREQGELDARELLYRGERPALELAGRTVVLVDDGLATGATMRAAVEAVRAAGASHVVAAAPVAPRETSAELTRAGIELVCVTTPRPFGAVGYWYRDFTPVSDAEVREALEA
ncbi:MAG TPA: phosphoribosyltransferase family protein [Gaiellaceae bacterium]|nr:phosphoribosyltransferase family protein [Gaiellaceae bacterium]